MFDGLANNPRLNRELLCRELRENPPPWFDYNSGKTCAIAVGAELGLNEPFPRLPLMSFSGFSRHLATAYGLSRHEAVRIFAGQPSYTTAGTIADLLEAAPLVVAG